MNTLTIVYAVACWTFTIVFWGWYNSKRGDDFFETPVPFLSTAFAPFIIPIVAVVLPFIGGYELGKYIHKRKGIKEARQRELRERNRIQPGHIRIK